MQTKDQRRYFLAALVALAFCNDVFAFDLSAEGDFCKSSNKKYPELKKIIIPAWSSGSSMQLPKESSCYDTHVAPATLDKNSQAVVDEALKATWHSSLANLNDFSHALNSYFLNNMKAGLYQRLLAARETGINLSKYKKSLQKLEAGCEQSDAAGKNLSKEAKQLASLAEEIQNDAKAFHLPESSPEQYIRLLTIAGLEAQRVKLIVHTLEKKLGQKNISKELTSSLIASLEKHEKRLLRIHFSYPALANLENPTGEDIEKQLHNEIVLSRIGIQSEKAIFFPDESVEKILKLNPVGQKGASIDTIAAPPAPAHLSKFYQNLYKDIFEGKISISTRIKNILLNANNASVEQAIYSAQLKCKNISPCMALSVEPELAAQLLEKQKDYDKLAPLVCACKLKEQSATVSDRQNILLGLSSGSAVVGAMFFPELTPLVVAAYGLAVADMGAAGAGIYDAFTNKKRIMKIAAMRAGGVSSGAEELETAAELDEAEYNLIYNSGTGVIGLLPPARITKEYVNLALKATLTNRKFIYNASTELAKAGTATPAPSFSADKYNETWDPRRYVPMLPAQLRDRYPNLFSNISAVLGATNFIENPAARDALMLDLKLAAEKMANSENPSDEILLKNGSIRSSLLTKQTRGLKLHFLIEDKK